MQTSQLELSIVVPVFNEEDNVPALVAELDAVLPLLPRATEVILVDDGSSDASWTHVVTAARTRPWLRGLRFLGNRGQTAAMAAGIAESRGALLAFLDADLQNDPRDLPAMLTPITEGRADVVCGWRADRRDAALQRRLPSVVANALIRRALDLRVHDVGCTLKVFRREYLEDAQLHGEMHRFIVVYAAAQGARIVEQKVGHRARRAGSSKYGLGRIYKVLIDIVTVKVLSSYGSKPAYFFGQFGFVFAALGLAAFAVVAYRAWVLDRPQSTPMIFMMMLFFLASLLSFMSGLLAEISIRILHAVGGRRPYRIVDRVGDAPAAADQRVH